MSAVDPKSDTGRVLLVLWATPTPLSLGEIAATVWPLGMPQYDQPGTRHLRMRIRGECVDQARRCGGELLLAGYARRGGGESLCITDAGIAVVESWLVKS